MEAEELNVPPPVLERLVQWAIPPMARETVTGDLREIYRNPAQYALEALRTVPLVALSCAGRAVNPPLLLLQGALILAGFAGLRAGSSWLSQTNLVVLTGAVLAVIVVRDTYRQTGRPNANRAIIEAIAIAALLIWFSPQGFGAPLTPRLALMLLSTLPFAIPLFGLLRTGLLVESDRHIESDSVCELALASQHQAFAQRRKAAYRIKAGLLAAIGAVSVAVPLFRTWLPLLYLPAAAALIFALDAPSGGNGDAQALRALYRRQLQQDRQLRNILWWLWATPVLVLLYRELTEAGINEHRAAPVIVGNIALILVCYLVGAANDEGSGRIEEKIDRLERLTASEIERV